MKKVKRVFWIVLDSFGVGELPDAVLAEDRLDLRPVLRGGALGDKGAQRHNVDGRGLRSRGRAHSPL